MEAARFAFPATVVPRSTAIAERNGETTEAIPASATHRKNARPIA